MSAKISYSLTFLNFKVLTPLHVWMYVNSLDFFLIFIWRYLTMNDF